MTAVEPAPANTEVELPYRPTEQLQVSLSRGGELIFETPMYRPSRVLSRDDLTFMAALDHGDGVSAPDVARTFGDEQKLMSLIDDRRWVQRAGRVIGDHPASRTSLPNPELSHSPQQVVQVLAPLGFYLSMGRYVHLDHAGSAILSFDADQLQALTVMVKPITVAAAWRRYTDEFGHDRLSAGAFRAVVQRLIDASIAITEDFPEPLVMLLDGDRSVFKDVFQRHHDQQNAAEVEFFSRFGFAQPRVVPVCKEFAPPLGLGMIVAHAKAYAGGVLDDYFRFRTDWFWGDEDAFVNKFTEAPAIYLFSNYMWNHRENLELSAAIKAASPNSITIHGGPDTPQYAGDDQAHFADFPSVDVVVRGEGEATLAAVLDRLRVAGFGKAPVDLSVLEGVEGICYRTPDGVARNADRDRIKELDVVPSPLLTGLFDAYREIPGLNWLIETNRGCPYGCTFCDWGSATKSRIRKFDLDRVLREIDFCIEAEAMNVGVADANFGIFERDVEIAEYVAGLRRSTGFPNTFGANFAKNTKKHLQHIIATLSDVDMFSQGTLSLQTMDVATLKEIRRTNIKTEKYDELAIEMRNAGLPLMIELMMGLPGSTVESMKNDLQECIDREVRARMASTVLLVNSPMNEPEYREKSKIKTNVPLKAGVNALVIESESFSEADYRRMERLRDNYMLLEELGVLRRIARVVRQEFGLREIDFYEAISNKALGAPLAYPHLEGFLRTGNQVMAPFGSWHGFYADVRRYFEVTEGIEVNESVAAAFQVQHALVPSFGRSFPEVIELDHDFVAWDAAMKREKLDNPTEWTRRVPRLAEFPFGRLRVDDPGRGVTSFVGMTQYHVAFGAHWEFASEVARAGTYRSGRAHGAA